MSLDWAALPLAALAGLLSILSPCIWPLVPITMASAANNGRAGPWAFAAGLCLSFALGGTVLTFALLNAGLGTEWLRLVSAVLLVLAGLILLIRPFAEALALQLSRLVGRFGLDIGTGGTLGQFGIGLMMGFVWLPCVGPTLGAAIALASLGQEMFKAFVVMAAYGFGAGISLALAGLLSARMAAAVKPALWRNAVFWKHAMGVLLLMMGLMVMTGLDKALETKVLQWLPEWLTNLS